MNGPGVPSFVVTLTLSAGVSFLFFGELAPELFAFAGLA